LKQYLSIAVEAGAVGKFRGICRGLIEAVRLGLWKMYGWLKFRGICRGLIEAATP